MGVSAKGYCIIGFPLNESELINRKALGVRCRSHGSLSTEFAYCPKCGQQTSVETEASWTDKAREAAKILGRELSTEYVELEDEFEKNYVEGIFGVSLEGSWTQKDFQHSEAEVRVAFDKARKLAQIFCPGEAVTISHYWGYGLS